MKFLITTKTKCLIFLKKISLLFLKKKIIFIILALTGGAMTLTCGFYFIIYPQIVIGSSSHVINYMLNRIPTIHETYELTLEYMIILKDAVREYAKIPQEIRDIFCPPHVFREWMVQNAPENIFRDRMGRFFYALPNNIYAAYIKIHHVGVFAVFYQAIDPAGYGAIHANVAQTLGMVAQQNNLIEVAEEIVKLENQDISNGKFLLVMGVLVGVTITAFSVYKIMI